MPERTYAACPRICSSQWRRRHARSYDTAASDIDMSDRFVCTRRVLAQHNDVGIDSAQEMIGAVVDGDCPPAPATPGAAARRGSDRRAAVRGGAGEAAVRERTAAATRRGAARFRRNVTLDSE